MQVEIKAVKKSQVVEWTVLYPTRVRRAKVIKTRKNAAFVLLENINDTGYSLLPADAIVTIVNI